MSLDVARADQGYVLCVGLSLEACGEVARLVQNEAVVVAAVDTDAARAILGASRPAPAPARAPQREADGPSRVHRGPIQIDVDAREASVGGQPLHLSPREFDLLEAMTAETDRVWSFAELTRRVWHTRYLGTPDVVISAIKRLRKRLESVAGLEVTSVRGIGYRLVVTD